jgi:hypothetical protein
MRKLEISIIRCAAPEATPEEVLNAVQRMFNDYETLDYQHGERMARKMIRALGWTPGNGWGSGAQYITEIHSATGHFWLKAILPGQ